LRPNEIDNINIFPHFGLVKKNIDPKMPFDNDGVANALPAEISGLPDAGSGFFGDRGFRCFGSFAGNVRDVGRWFSGGGVVRPGANKYSGADAGVIVTIVVIVVAGSNPVRV
jgi:hypothetical protein